MTDLAAFLLARYQDEEALARAAGGLSWHVRGEHEMDNRYVDGPDDFTIYDEGGHNEHQAAHIARWDPARVLAEVEAKRQIVKRYQTCVAENERNSRFFEDWKAAGGSEDGDGDMPDDPEARRRTTSQFETAGLAIAVRLLALPYVEHPGYQESWKP